MSHYSTLGKFSRSAAAVKNAAARRGYSGSIHSESPKVGTHQQQIDAVTIYHDARRAEPEVPIEWLWKFSKSAVLGSGRGHRNAT